MIELKLGQSGKNCEPKRIGTGWKPFYKAKLSGTYSFLRLVGNIVSKGGYNKFGLKLDGIFSPSLNPNNPRTCA